MGECNHVRCQKCGYSADTKNGPGFTVFRELVEAKNSILNGEIVNEDALNCLKSGGELCAVAAYLCPTCRAFFTNNQMYCLTNKRVSPYGTVHYDVVFPFGKPKCSICKTELVYIDNIRSSKIKCPKCGGELVARLSGYYD